MYTTLLYNRYTNRVGKKIKQVVVHISYNTITFEYTEKLWKKLNHQVHYKFNLSFSCLNGITHQILIQDFWTGGPIHSC